jgi:hypothetical protein
VRSPPSAPSRGAIINSPTKGVACGELLGYSPHYARRMELCADSKVRYANARYALITSEMFTKRVQERFVNRTPFPGRGSCVCSLFYIVHGTCTLTQSDHYR